MSVRGGEQGGRGLIERGYELEELVVSVWNLELELELECLSGIKPPRYVADRQQRT